MYNLSSKCIPILFMVCRGPVPKHGPCTPRAKACSLPGRPPTVAGLPAPALGLEPHLSAEQLPLSERQSPGVGGWEKLNMLLLRRKADGDVRKDEEPKQKGGDHLCPRFLHSSLLPCSPSAAPLPLNIPAALPPPMRRPGGASHTSPQSSWSAIGC